MGRNFLFVIAAFFLSASLSLVAGQTPIGGQKPSAVTGDVSSISETAITLTTKDGTLEVSLSAATQYKRVPPENPTLSAAVAAQHSEISVGDKLLVTGILSDDKRAMPARSVYLMTKSDIAQKQQKESQEWATRGLSGKVASINADTGQIGVEVRGLANTTTVVLTPKPGAVFKRYAQNSVKYSEAKNSSLAEIQAGDMVRALGDKSADGASFTAEQVVTGAFQTVAGTVKTIDAEKNEIVITDAHSKKDVTVELGSASMIKRFPEEMATRLAMMQAGGMGMRPAGAAPTGDNSARPAGGQPGAAGQGRPGFGGGQRGGGIDDMLERFPNITAGDLKPGEVIAVSSSKSMSPERITAIKLLAGVEPFLRAAQAQQSAAGRRGQSAPSLDIPGLDGLSFP
ncbi:MAG: hypothetical protein ABI539_03560 [Acidobacteriota bacterium]